MPAWQQSPWLTHTARGSASRPGGLPASPRRCKQVGILGTHVGTHTLDGQLRVAPVTPHAPTRGVEVAQTILAHSEA
eukprot:2065113-Alexandrium_andersonii.AAC.1